MADLTKILNLQTKLGTMRTQLGNTEDKIERLKKAKNALSTEQEMLHNHKARMNEPEIDGNAWRGNAASEHEDIRSEMHASYVDAQDRAEGMLSSIESEISNLQGEASRCLTSILTMETSLQTLRNRLST
ncbi:DUF5082 domain-containing protein [Shouchella hunanensis]|uniref:DUF5082 domain-containing protein n=1 Tax=Shouchella hunanensis TaxID=766894 RepID=A0ABY7W2I4_9BACI|nr:DUF5082 domain-containing protein [Shouchella hunanensis]WDF02112.1 DUF5082 domain-containing protein [Shouchella hunanensis]